MLKFFPSQPPLSPQESLSVIGIGGAGTHIINHLKNHAPASLKLITLNSGSQLIQESQADVNMALGSSLTRGLSCGGDPDLGRKAAEATLPELAPHIQPSKLVLLTVGLGGGTGSGAAPVIAKKIREEGAFLIVFATLPFSFEGSRRINQAKDALNELSLYANILISFENDRMGELIAAEKGVQEAFSLANNLVAEAISALSLIALKPGLIQLGLADIGQVLGNNVGRCLFGFGSAVGSGRGKLALMQALASPLLSQRDALSKVPDILVHISGGHNLTLAEIESLMKELSTHLSPSANIHFGVSIDEQIVDTLRVVILTGLPTALPTQKQEEVVIIDDPHLGEPEEENEYAAPEPAPPAPAPTPTITFYGKEEPTVIEEPTPEPPPVKRRIIEEELPLPIPGKIGEEIKESIINGNRAAEANASPPHPVEARDPEPGLLFPTIPPRRPTTEEQRKLEFTHSAKGKFASDQIDLIDGEDLDLPPALRKKKP